MWRIFLILLFTTPVMGQELERNTITSCAYQSGAAEEIQLIRQREGDDWETFKSKVMQIYKPTQGRADLLAIAKRVYLQPPSISSEKVHADMFKACVIRTQDKEEKV